MKTLIAFATAWGSKYGGINCFNTDFLSAFGVAYHNSVQVICIVASAIPEEIEEARNSYVSLVPLPYPPQEKLFTPAQAQIGIDEIKRRNIIFEPANTVWLGHDRITGAAAVAAAKAVGGQSALIHHMSYDHYESYAENSKTAFQKTQEQISLFQQADLVLAIGPLLRDALSDRLGSSKPVHMLIPGLAEIEARCAPKTFTAFLSGRLSDDAAKIKQGHLGVAAFAKAHCEARKNGMPDGLCRPPKLVVRGVDFDSVTSDPETELKKFAEEFAECIINLQALPYTQERKELYDGLASASVALMPSWHEGFGLVAWEAIAAGVPLIISKNSGVYQLLDEEFLGAGTGCVYPINVAGKNDPPYFREDDLDRVVSQINMVAQKSDMARRQAGILRNLVGKYTWPACAEQAAKAFDWSMQKGIIPTSITNQLPVAFIAAPAITSTSTSPLSMPSKQWQIGGGVADSQLLRAEEALVPFDPARQPELNVLKEWLDDTKWPLAVRLITGAGGLGKTRLALELCQRRLASGWHAGLLDTDLAAKDMATCWQTLQKLNQPTLIVIDYAETRQPELLSLIKAIQQNKGNSPVRLLLLARDGGEWWDNLPSKDPQCESLLNGYATSGPFCLPALHASDQDRRKAYLTAQNAFANALGVSASDVVPELAGEYFDRPLYLQMAALLALHGERPTTAEGLTKAFLSHERRYWRGLLSQAFAEPERHAQDLLALATLAGGFSTQKDAQSYWARVNGNSLSTAEFHNLFHALVPLYPGKQGLQAVRPDILGEALVAQALLSSDKGHPLDAVLSNSASQAIRRNALTVLARLSDQRLDLHETLVDALVRHFSHCCLDILEVATETPGQLPGLAEAAFVRLQSAVKSQVAGLLAPTLLEESVQLAELSCSVWEYRAYKARYKMQKKASIDFKADYAGVLVNYAVSLNRAGRDDKALSHTKYALELFKELYNIQRSRFEPNYASALNNYSNYLAKAGIHDHVLLYAKQALDIRQRLAQKKPDRFEPDYATSLNNYAGHLSEAGKEEEALIHAKQALDIYERLAQNKPDRFEPDYAMSLSNYANRLSKAGKDEEALIHAKQALDIRKRLTQNKPDRFEPDYAASLNNYANRLSDIGKDEAALIHAKQALEIWQRLAQNKPDRFEADYAKSLSNYANHLSKAGKEEEALIHSKQALDIHQRSAQNKPDRFEPDYAMSLNNYANRLNKAGKDEAALIHSKQALDIHQRLAQKKPDRFEPDYATSLSNYANHLSDAGEDEEALIHAKQALDIRQRLAQKNEERYLEDQFNSTCYVLFLRWLSDNRDSGIDITDLSNIPTKKPALLRPLSQLYSAFVDACWSQTEAARAENFKIVITSSNDLTRAHKIQAQAYWLCAAAWSAKFAPSAVAEVDWQPIWHQYASQRQGRIPHWMNEVARRMKFQWPE